MRNCSSHGMRVPRPKEREHAQSESQSSASRKALDRGVVALERLEVGAHRRLPLLLAVLEVPLVDERDDALDVGRRARRDEAFGLEVCEGLAVVDHRLLLEGLASCTVWPLNGPADMTPL